MEFIPSIREKARMQFNTIVLPEGEEDRMIKAAGIISQEKLAKLIMIGDESIIRSKAEDLNVSLKEIDIRSAGTDERFDQYSEEYYELRKTKGLTLPQAKETMKNPLFYGAMLVRKGMADGSVAGSIHTTGDVLRAALHLIGLRPGISVVSGAFIMVIPGWEDVFTFADSAVVPDPTAEQLAAIARTSARTHFQLTGKEPVVAMLSFSTMGSAEHSSVDKVREALKIAKKQEPSLRIDGELQVDAAILPEIGKRKAPNSNVAGKANVLIFPDLNAGNIGYKLVNRFAKAEAIGPIVQGLNKPANDLSRGCSVEDIVNVVAICSLMSN
jgi:phosphate acetyltransferase